jgi:hypothetical protein
MRRNYVFCSALIALTALTGQVHSGQLSLSVDLNGVVIFTQGSSSPDQGVTADLAVLNATLAAHGSAYQFTSLSASSNFSGASTGDLGVTGALNTLGSGDTSAVLSVDVAQGGFLSPTGADGSLVSSAGGSYTSASGSLSFTSDYQGALSPTLVFPVSGSNSFAATTGAVPLGAVPSGYELSNHFLVSIAADPSASLTFTGDAQLSVTGSGAVPEPASFVLLLMGMPLSGLLLRRSQTRRKRILPIIH